jgi:hypothetical protein
MNLYKITRSPRRFKYDTYAFAVVAATSEDQAKHTHPAKEVMWKNRVWTVGGVPCGNDTWASPSRVHAKLLGLAKKGTVAGTICTSFHEA